MSTVYHKHHRCSFSSQSGALLVCHGTVTDRASDDRHLERHYVCYKALYSKKISRLGSELLDGKFFRFRELRCVGN